MGSDQVNTLKERDFQQKYHPIFALDAQFQPYKRLFKKRGLIRAINILNKAISQPKTGFQAQNTVRFRLSSLIAERVRLVRPHNLLPDIARTLTRVGRQLGVHLEPTEVATSIAEVGAALAC